MVYENLVKKVEKKKRKSSLLLNVLFDEFLEDVFEFWISYLFKDRKSVV